MLIYSKAGILNPTDKPTSRKYNWLDNGERLAVLPFWFRQALLFSLKRIT